MSFLASTAELREYVIQGAALRLQMHPLVFPPSEFGVQFAAHVRVRPGERVADIGTGTGIHAILAALKGAREVVATDTCAPALELTQHNARINGVRHLVATRYGSFFAGANGAFDVLIANLPQEIVPAEYLAGLNGDQADGVNGGGDGGNGILLDFLRIAPDFMHATSRLYIIVNTVTDWRRTLEVVRTAYTPTLLWHGSAPTKDFVASAMPWYRELMRRGVVDLFLGEAGEWCAREYVYELRRL